jgi:hypothetical protein
LQIGVGGSNTEDVDIFRAGYVSHTDTVLQ